MLDAASLVVVLALGLLAGTMGGMLGVGGSIIMIPGLTLALGTNQHLYQAAAMIANVAVALPAARRHWQAGATVTAVLRWMLPMALVFVVMGVWASNWPIFRGTDNGQWLGRLLALFLLYVIVDNIRHLRNGTDHAQDDPNGTSERIRVTPVRSGSIGAVMGTTSGLLGIGGGALAVPLQQVLLHLPLRRAIANSSLVMVISAAVGAIYKNATLDTHGVAWQKSLILAACLAPTCALGGRIGASLTHRLPLKYVRLAFIALMIVAAWRMLALPAWLNRPA